jgi:ATP-dependent Zn protease
MIAAKEAIAYHEAGHAVLSMQLGYKCLYVTIIPDGVRLGHVCCEDPLIGAHADKIEHALKVLIGAGLAEGRQVGSKSWGDADDRASATKLALSATDGDAKRAGALIDQLTSETRELVERHWPDIETLAQRLLVEEQINFLQTKARESR